MKIRFKHYRANAPCPSCLDRNALNLVGRPLFVNGVRLSAGCEECDGKGRVEQMERINGWPKPELWTVRRTKHVPEPET